MCVGNTSTPAPPPALPEAPRTPDRNQSLRGSGDERRRRAAAAGQTLLTSSRGATGQANTSVKTLLSGQ